MRPALSKYEMFNRSAPANCEDNISQIMNLAKVGAAAADTGAGIEHLLDAERAVFELVYSLAAEAYEMLHQERAARD